MKTFLPSKQKFLSFVLLTAVVILAPLVRAQSGTGGSSLGNGLKFEAPQLSSGTDLQVGAKYLFSNVETNVDAVVSIDSLVNGAKVSKIDDNSNGTGYKEAFQPAVQSGGIVGMSYAVFTVKLYQHGTTNPVSLAIVNATALDLDGNNTLKEFARINIGANGTMKYMVATPDITVNSLGAGDFLGKNTLGIERDGIDTSSLANMFTASNSNISSFTVKYGTITTNSSNAVRQFSLYMKKFEYAPVTLPVKLSFFTATLSGSANVELKWTTATEFNVNHFVVERSIDGVNFSDAGMVFAFGNTTSKTDYSLTDKINNVVSEIIYYRLRSVDIDSKSQLSEIRIIRVSKQTAISILTYPNPVSNELRITIPANWQNKKAIYEIANANGQVAKRTETASSSQTETINISSLAPGFYIVKVICEGQTAQQKIIKN